MSIYDDKILLWNPGELTDGLTIEKLKSKHPSKSRNRNMAEVFFKAGYIESWGRGIEKMTHSLREVGYPAPIFEENAGGFQVTFKKEKFTPIELEEFGLNQRQIVAYIKLKEQGVMTSSEYQRLTNIGKSVAATELQQLVDKGIFSIEGVGRATKYVLAY